jgi:hypothetical protein
MIFGHSPGNHPNGRGQERQYSIPLAQVFTKKINDMNKIVLRYGLLSGLVGALLGCLNALYFSNHGNNGMLVGYAGILLSALFVFFGVRAYREQLPDGRLSFGKAFQVGILITLISCALYVIAWMIVEKTLMPDFMDKYVAQSLAQLRASGADALKVQQETAKMEEFKVMYRNPLYRAAMTFIEPFPVGLLVTLVSALALKRK